MGTNTSSSIAIGVPFVCCSVQIAITLLTELSWHSSVHLQGRYRYPTDVHLDACRQDYISVWDKVSPFWGIAQYFIKGGSFICFLEIVRSHIDTYLSQSPISFVYALLRSISLLLFKVTIGGDNPWHWLDFWAWNIIMHESECDSPWAANCFRRCKAICSILLSEGKSSFSKGASRPCADSCLAAH
jgi:hypothetical protein